MRFSTPWRLGATLAFALVLALPASAQQARQAPPQTFLRAPETMTVPALDPRLDIDAAPFGVSALRTGGPDAAGYSFTDSSEPGGPTFAWIDISSTSATPGTAFAATDDNISANIPIGFNFTFYGTVYTGLKIAANGNIQFATVGDGTAANQNFPSSASPNQIIAPYWDDLIFNRTGNNSEVRYQLQGTSPNRRFVVSWIRGDHYYPSSANTSNLTFQAILYEDVNTPVRFQYETITLGNANEGGVAGTLPIVTAGTEGSGAPGQGLTVHFGTGYFTSGLAIQFTKSTPPAPVPAAYASSAMDFEFTGTAYADGFLYYTSRERVVISGNSGTIPVTSLTFDLANAPSVLNARLYYWGTSPTVPTTTLFGAIVTNPGSTVTFTGTQALAPGTYYFTFAVQIRTGAVPGTTIDSDFLSVTVGGAPFTPSPTDIGNVLTVGAPPVNDNLANAKVLVATPYTDSQTNIGAYVESGEAEATCAFSTNDGFDSIWYSYTPGTNGSATFTSNGFDTIQAVYTGSPLAEVACADNFSSGTAETNTLNVTAGTRYYFRVTSYNGNSGTAAVNISGPAPIAQRLANGRGYRILSAPVTGMTVGTLAGINLVQGVTGQYPGGTNTVAPNIFLSYTGSGGYQNSGYNPATNVTDALTPGAGFFWQLYDLNLTPPSDANNGGGTSRSYTLASRPLDVNGTVLNANASVLFDGTTNTFHLGGNPFSRAMTADGVTGDVSIQNDLQVFGPNAQGVFTFTPVSRVAPVGTLSTWQGFFIEQTTAGAALTVTYDASKRVAGNGTIVGRTDAVRELALALTGTTADGVATADEAAVVRVVDGATASWDAADASKLVPPAGPYALLAPVGERDGQPNRQAVLSVPSADGLVTLAFMATHAGTYTITGAALGLPEGTTAEVRDLVTGAVADAMAGYTFTSGATDWADRFVLEVTTDGAVSNEPGAPTVFALAAPAPNPTSSSATVAFDVPEASNVNVTVYDLLGRRVAVLAQGQVAAGHHSARLDAGHFAPGVYVVRMEAGTFSATRRLTVVR